MFSVHVVATWSLRSLYEKPLVQYKCRHPLLSYNYRPCYTTKQVHGHFAIVWLEYQCPSERKSGVHIHVMLVSHCESERVK